MSLMHLPLYTGFITAFLLLMQLFLMGRVIAQRGKSEVLIGDGGQDSMEQVIRVHANFLENVPTFLIGLGLCEIMIGSNLAIAILGGVFVVARIAHAVGYSMSAGVTQGRLIGTLGTMITTLGVAGYLAYITFTKM